MSPLEGSAAGAEKMPQSPLELLARQAVEVVFSDTEELPVNPEVAQGSVEKTAFPDDTPRVNQYTPPHSAGETLLLGEASARARAAADRVLRLRELPDVA